MRFQVTFFFFVDAVLLGFAILSVQIAVDWLREGLSKDTCSSAISCNSACVLQVILGRSHWNCYIMDAIWMLGLARNSVFFSGKRRLWVGEKLAPARNALRISYRCRRFAVKSSSICARTWLRVSGYFFFCLFMLWYSTGGNLRHIL